MKTIQDLVDRILEIDRMHGELLLELRKMNPEDTIYESLNDENEKDNERAGSRNYGGVSHPLGP